MHTMEFENKEQAAFYRAGFEHAMEYACDAWELMQHRGQGTVNDRRLALRCFAREYLARPVEGDACALAFEHLEDWSIGFDRSGVFTAKPKQQEPLRFMPMSELLQAAPDLWRTSTTD